MDTLQPNDHKRECPILKSNLWKFFKTLRVEANPIYGLLAASPAACAWIAILRREGGGGERRITIGQFLATLKKMPSTGYQYRLQIQLPQGIFTASCLSELNVEAVGELLPKLILTLCHYHRQQGERLELTPSFISRYNIKQRYLEELKPLFEEAERILNREN